MQVGRVLSDVSNAPDQVCSDLVLHLETVILQHRRAAIGRQHYRVIPLEIKLSGVEIGNGGIELRNTAVPEVSRSERTVLCENVVEPVKALLPALAVKIPPFHRAVVNHVAPARYQTVAHERGGIRETNTGRETLVPDVDPAFASRSRAAGAHAGKFECSGQVSCRGIGASKTKIRLIVVRFGPRILHTPAQAQVQSQVLPDLEVVLHEQGPVFRQEFWLRGNGIEPGAVHRTQQETRVGIPCLATRRAGADVRFPAAKIEIAGDAIEDLGLENLVAVVKTKGKGVLALGQQQVIVKTV